MVYELAASQKRIVAQLVGLLSVGGEWRNVLIIGAPGSGKRTIARAAAKEMGIEFIEVPMGDTASALRARLLP